MKKVLVFGIFDGLHPGHLSFFRQAKKHGDVLIVAVGRASACKQIKCKIPKHSLKERMEAIRNVPFVSKVVPGDIRQRSYKVILREKPDVVCLGYDQVELKRSITEWIKTKATHVKIQLLKAYKPEKYHTSIITKKEAA